MNINIIDLKYKKEERWYIDENFNWKSYVG